MADEAISMTLGGGGGEEQQPDGSDEDDNTTMDPDILKKKATRMLKIFRQIAECLEVDVVTEIKEMLSHVISISRTADADKKEEELTQVYLLFLDKVEFRAGISVNLIVQAIRCFMMIEEDTEGLGQTVNEMYLEMIVIDHPSLAIDMKLTDDLLKLYFKLVDEGYEEMQHIRLMVVGMYEVGKTTLVRKLCGKPIDDVTTTEGVDILLDSCEVKEDFDWEVSDPKKREKYLNLRLRELITKYRKQDKKSDTSTVKRSHVPEPTPSTEMPSNDKPEYDDFKNSVTRNDQKQKHEDKIVVELKEIAKKEEEPLKRRPSVSIWDFAGQSVYYSTHHFFLNARSIYILVLNLSKGLHEKAEEDNIINVEHDLNLGNITKGYTCLDTFKFWMKSIYIYTKQKKASLPDNQKKEYTPKIILVGTFKDKISDKRDLTAYKDDYFAEALYSFKGTSIIDIVHRKTFLISNTDSDENDFLLIRKEIYNISTEMPMWNEKVPAKFIPLEKAIFQQTNDKRLTMKFSELKEVGLNVEYPINEAEIKLFLAFQHALGNVLYYNMGTRTDQDDGRDLSELIILKPQWIINAFKAFVTHKDKTDEIHRTDSWYEFEHFGQLQKDLVDALLQEHNFLEEKDNILMYMEYLEVIAKPVIRTESDKDLGTPSAKREAKHYFLDRPMKTQTKERDFYVMPCMLPSIPDMDMLKELYKEPDKDTHHTTLCMYSKKGFLPAFVFHRILATAIKELPIAFSNATQLLFNGLGSFNLTERWMLTIWCKDSIIHLRVTFKGACKDEKEEMEYCMALRMRFEKLVLEVFNLHRKDPFDEVNKAELFSVHVKCPRCKEQVPFDAKKDRSTRKPVDYMMCIHSVENLLDVKEKYCGCCNKRITSGGDLKYWFNQQRVYTREFTQQQNEMLHMEVKCCHLVDLAKEISIKKLRRLSQEIGISDTQLERIEDENPTVRFVYSTLYHWKMKRDGWKSLYDSMNSVGLNTDNFSRIIRGEVNTKDEKMINTYMEEIKKDENDILILSDRQIGKLSTCFGNEYWFFGLRLGINQKQMDHIALENKNIQTQITKILNAWRSENEPIRIFIKALVLSDCDWNLIRPFLINEED